MTPPRERCIIVSLSHQSCCGRAFATLISGMQTQHRGSDWRLTLTRPVYIIGLTWGVPSIPPKQYLTLSLRGLGFNVFQTNLLTIPSQVLSGKQFTLRQWSFRTWNLSDRVLSHSCVDDGMVMGCGTYEAASVRRSASAALGAPLPHLAEGGLHRRVLKVADLGNVDAPGFQAVT